MRFALSHRAVLIIGAAAAIGALVELLAVNAATSGAAVADPERTPATTRPAVATLSTTNKYAGVSTLTPAAAALLMKLAHRTTDPAAANHLFASKSWYVAPPPPPPAPPAPAAAPTAPPFPYAFVGSYAPQGGNAVYFLVKNDRIYDVHPGDTLDGVYSFDGVENGQLRFTYKPLMILQTLPAGGNF